MGEGIREKERTRTDTATALVEEEEDKTGAQQGQRRSSTLLSGVSPAPALNWSAHLFPCLIDFIRPFQCPLA